jgi:hypothetical protein
MAGEQTRNDSGPAAPPSTESHEAIDIQQLAERVYRLMVRETRLARARGATAGRRKE